MGNYVTRELEVNVIRWNGNNDEEIRNLTNNYAKVSSNYVEVSQGDGMQVAIVGDYIVSDEEGNVSIYKPVEFNKKYKEVL